jgi:hypothetical protein
MSTVLVLATIAIEIVGFTLLIRQARRIRVAAEEIKRMVER